MIPVFSSVSQINTQKTDISKKKIDENFQQIAKEKEIQESQTAATQQAEADEQEQAKRKKTEKVQS